MNKNEFAKMLFEVLCDIHSKVHAGVEASMISAIIDAIEVKEEYPPYPNFGKGQVNNPPEKSEVDKWREAARKLAEYLNANPHTRDVGSKIAFIDVGSKIAFIAGVSVEELFPKYEEEVGGI